MASDQDKITYLFGRDIRTIPCLRTSGLFGIGAGVSTMLLHFLFTSNPRKSSQYGVTVFACVTFPYWFYCRMKVYREELAFYTFREEVGEKTQDEYLILDSLEFGNETSS